MVKFSGLEIFGLISLIVILLFVLKWFIGFVYKYVLGPAINKVDFRSKGQWALVTGCTDGIGKAYAEALASRGCDIVLVSRSMDKLKTVAEKIESDHKVRTHVIAADFTRDDIYDKIRDEVGGLEIGTLVNNVGMSYASPEFFLDCTQNTNLIDDLIKANMVSVTKMCSIVMPAMVQRKRGVVINIGSISSTIPSPLLTIYAATKAYVDKLTEDLCIEYSSEGIVFQCVMPGFVVSNMSKLKRSSFFAPTAADFVRSALSQCGTCSRTTGYLPHSFLFSTLQTINAISHEFSSWIVKRNMLILRRKAHKLNKSK